MLFKLNLDKTGRLALAIAALTGSSLLVLVIVSRFVIGTLADDHLPVTREMLQVPVGYLPNSARLNARLAWSELSESEGDLATAKAHAERSVNLSPNDYRFRLTLASIEEAIGNRAAAEAALEAARALAPNYWSVHYRLGNLLVREGKLAQSLDEFRIAVAAKDSILPGALDLLWRASGGDVGALRTVAGAGPKPRIALARFLIKVSHREEAARVFGGIDRADLLAFSLDSAAFLNSLIAAGEFGLARDLWGEIAGGDRQSTLLWNGGFESDPLKDFAQFDWSFAVSEFARFAMDTTVAHSGARSLRIEFAGRDTTRLDNEVRQLLSVRPGARYSLECYVKATELETPEGPRVVVSGSGPPVWLAASEPVVQGSTDWHRLVVDFVAPQSASGGTSVFVSIKRKPKFSYDEPTRGTVWFDDFSLKEL
jgi:tetratricopeptide (TPR) repeat protein